MVSPMVGAYDLLLTGTDRENHDMPAKSVTDESFDMNIGVSRLGDESVADHFVGFAPQCSSTALRRLETQVVDHHWRCRKVSPPSPT